MVETAFIFVVFVTMMVGIFDFGQFLFIHQALVERARAAVRWGAVNGPSNTTAIRNKVLYDSATVPNGATQGYFGLTTSNVQVTNTGALTDNHKITISITNFSYTTLSPFFAGTRTSPEIRVTMSLGMFN